METKNGCIEARGFLESEDGNKEGELKTSAGKFSNPPQPHQMRLGITLATLATVTLIPDNRLRKEKLAKRKKGIDSR